jgi:hypothetical protein
MKSRWFELILLPVIFAVLLISCAPLSVRGNKSAITIIQSNIDGRGTELSLEFHKGPVHNHPSFAIWLEDLEGNFIQTLFTTRYVATGTYGYGELESGKWKPEPGEAVRPATLPYWSHKRGQKTGKIPDLPSPENPLPDAISGATPSADFVLKTNSDRILLRRFRVLLEINQPWDSNRYWTNNKFPDDYDYLTSLQPALVYAVTVDLDSEITEYYLNPIGHSHYSGKDGLLYTDLSTFTTALQIAEKIVVRVARQVP